ncbi:hypothetical protein B484DRAFT_450822 [Ochromonadaceae sp. CCMP2298]|nr:hypothetical protein B484DRAFT_450822 [Ochromonadaceae sp. CCMP2298]|mmetsp:Transcript_3610/g.8175  ORF Transcript_3610/g.8175 Transcript_3610/m.8175 type:complete len:367 (-) Transcript_3610:189-1289(-)
MLPQPMWTLLLLLLLPWGNKGDPGDPFGLIDALQTSCEQQSMSLASRLSDTFSSYDENTDTATRLQDQYLVGHLDTRALTLANKWVYLYGDLTLRTLFTTLLQQTHPDHAANCSDQPRTTTHLLIPDTGSTDHEAQLHEGQNRSADHHNHHNHLNHIKAKGKTCHFSGFGETGKLSFDWKHTPYDEYDKWVFSEEGPWKAQGAEGAQSPDLLVMQVGHSTCAHSMDPEKASSELLLDGNTREKHIKEVEVLMDAVKRALQRAGRDRYTVLVVTAPRVVVGNDAADRCTWEVNRRVAKAAHERGFAVLEREEIEHRLGYRMLHSADLHGRDGFQRLELPVAPVVTTTLVSMLQCLGNATKPLAPASV